jgi:tetratricopeptide (TPR) repeat protein
MKVVSPRLLPLLLIASVLGGCVYYNGMYNANRLAKSARKAERDGRTLEANNLWGQVATKAESVIVRHPKSKYADEAAVLKGLALSRLGQCEHGLAPLGRASLLKGQSDLAEEALLATGRCQLAMGNLVAADAAFVQLLESRNKARRAEARYQHARAARLAGRYEEAVDALEGITDPRADDERILALAGAGRSSQALALADSLLARGDTSKSWDSLVVILGRQDPATASSLVDNLRRLPNRPAELQARWLVEDGQRLLSVDTVRAVARFQEAIVIGGQGEAAGGAALQMLRLNLSRATIAQELPPYIQKLKNLAAQHPATAATSNQLATSVAGVLAASSIPGGSSLGDLRLFLGAETARDTLAAPRLATGLFHRIVDEWPSSPYAPKAILAAQQLDSAWTDSARLLLEERYLDSPYLAVVRGEDTPAYRQLEDSLGAFAARLAPPPQRRAPSPRQAQPTGDDDGEPRRQPQPAPTVRVVEPR